MAEEVVDEVVDEVVVPDDDAPVEPEEAEKPEKKPLTVEEAAEKIGWNPNYDGPNKKSAIEYIIEGRNIQEQVSKTLKDERRHFENVRKDMANAVEFVRKQAEAKHQEKISELETRIRTLQKERRTAVEEADVERFEATEKALGNAVNVLNAEKSAFQAKPEPKQEPSTFDALFSEWKKANDWYGKDEALTRYATAFRDDPRVAGLDDSQYLKFVREETEKAFPHKFAKAEPSAAPASPVASAGAVRRGAGAKPTANPESGLSYQQRQVLDEYERMGIIKTAAERKQYAAEMSKGA